MVKMKKIYKRKGEKGKKGIESGKRRMKCEMRVEEYGKVDEENECVGMESINKGEKDENDEIDEMMESIKKEILEIGEDI